jgi:hypothetical protein
VDNLNPLFLYREMSKEKVLFSCLMQALSRHLRPAPYPYGLLTLRLLGKLGGNNRAFLREPLLLSEDIVADSARFEIRCHWTPVDGASKCETSAVVISVPIRRCLRMLKLVALTEGAGQSHVLPKFGRPDTLVKEWSDCSMLWDCRIDKVDFESYKESVAKETMHSQASACLNLVISALESELSKGEAVADHDIMQVACTAMMYGSLIDPLRNKAFAALVRHIPSLPLSPLSLSLIEFMCDAPMEGEQGVLDVLTSVLKLVDGDFGAQLDRQKVLDVILLRLCAAYSCSSWSRHAIFQKAILMMVQESDAAQSHEWELVNSAFMALKSIPRELSRATVSSFSFIVRLCSELYGSPRVVSDHKDDFVWDIWPIDDAKGRRGDTEEQYAFASQAGTSRPSENVFRTVLHDLASVQHIVRYVKMLILLLSTQVVNLDILLRQVYSTFCLSAFLSESFY